MSSQKEPEFGSSGLGPIWWHHHGIKVGMLQRKKREDPLEFTSGAASLKIVRDAGRGYLATWRIIHGPSSSVTGSVFFSEKELKQAFGVTDDIVWQSEAGLIEQYGATTASAGVFIRFQKWLNIPCPGTGKDGDPNLSMKISEKIKKEVQRFMDGN